MHLVAAHPADANRGSDHSLRVCLSEQLGAKNPAVQFIYSTPESSAGSASGQVINRVGVSNLPFGVERMILDSVGRSLASKPSIEQALAELKVLTQNSSPLATVLKSMAGTEAKSTACSGRPFSPIDATAPSPTTDIGVIFPDGSMAVTTIRDRGMLDSMVLTTISSTGEMRSFTIRSLKQDLPSRPLLSKAIFTSMNAHGSIQGLEVALCKQYATAAKS